MSHLVISVSSISTVLKQVFATGKKILTAGLYVNKRCFCMKAAGLVQGYFYLKYSSERVTDPLPMYTFFCKTPVFVVNIIVIFFLQVQAIICNCPYAEVFEGKPVFQILYGYCNKYLTAKCILDVFQIRSIKIYLTFLFDQLSHIRTLRLHYLAFICPAKAKGNTKKKQNCYFQISYLFSAFIVCIFIPILLFGFVCIAELSLSLVLWSVMGKQLSHKHKKNIHTRQIFI